MSSRAFYDAIADALTSFLPPSRRDFGWYRTAHNIKLWYGDEQREHYEVQHIRRGSGYVLEIGFHTEHSSREANDALIERLAAKARTWRKTLGTKVEVGPFIGRQSGVWRRMSEVWTGPISGDAAVEAAERLAAYINAIEPLRATVKR